MAKSNLDLVILALEKKFKTKKIAKASECKSLKIWKVPTGSYMMDYSLKGGFPRRRLIEIFASEHTGKSYFLYKFIAYNQNRCRNCDKLEKECDCGDFENYVIVLFDFEEGYNSDWIDICGIDREKLMVSTPSSYEECINYLEYLVKENLIDIGIIDSLTQAPVEYILDREAADPTMGVKAARNSVFCSKILSAFSADDITKEKDGKKPVIIFTQQVRDQIGGYSPYALPPKPPGGWALKHNKHLSIGLKNKFLLDDQGNERKGNKEVCGKKIAARIYKDKIEGEYLKDFEMDFYIKDIVNEDLRIKAGEIDNIKEIIDIAVLEEIIEQTGAWYKIPNVENKISGKNNLRIFFAEQTEIYEEIKKQVEKIIYG